MKIPTLDKTMQCTLIYMAFLIFGPVITWAQPQWPVTVTGDNHTVIIEASIPIDLMGNNIAVGDYIGVFFDDNGTMRCAGKAEWTGANLSVTVYGDDSTTPEKDGFASGEIFRWKVWRAATNEEMNTVAMYKDLSVIISHIDGFAVDGISALAGLSASVIVASCPIQPMLTATLTECQQSGATASVSPIGGTEPYDIRWDINGTEQQGPSVSGLSLGAYSVTIRDANCSVTVDFIITFSERPRIEWQKPYGGDKQEVGRSVVQTSDGGYIVAGNTKSSMNQEVTERNGGGSDIWVVKTDDKGEIMWQKNYGGEADEEAFDIAQTDDGGYIVVGYSASSLEYVWGNHGMRDLYVLKLDAMGDTLWTRSLGGSNDEEARRVICTAEGNYFIAGWSKSDDGNVGENSGLEDYWILKLDAQGTILQSKVYGMVNADFLRWAEPVGNDGYVLAGWATFSTGAGIDAWIIRIDNDGTVLWEKNYGGTRGDEAHAVQPLSDGNFIMVGESRSMNGFVESNKNGEDLWLVKMDQDGEFLWTRNYGGSLSDVGRNIRETADGGFIVAGFSNSTDQDIWGNLDNGDFWVLQFNSVGDTIWTQNYGGGSAEEAWSMDLTSDGGVILTGFTGSNSGNVSGNHGEEDVWLLKLGCALTTGQENLALLPPGLLQVYPNPTRDHLVIKMEPSSSQPKTISILNLQGQVILNETLDENLPYEKELSLENIPKGTYLLRVQTKDGLIVKKILLQ